MEQTIQPTDVAQFAPEYYTAVRNVSWNNAEHTSLTCEVNFLHVGFEEWTPFCADPRDYMPYSKKLFDECVAGKWGPVAEYIVPVEPEPPVVQPQPVTQGVQTL